MNSIVQKLVIVLWTSSHIFTDATDRPPNIILIVADDLGYNDVGYHGSNEIKTPTLDRLAAEGIKLEDYYTQPLCTPSRSSLLFGRYVIHSGLQHRTIQQCRPYGQPLEDISLADKLKERGYSTHMIGKWHLGFYKEEYTPVERGFDTFYGFYGGSEDYYTKQCSSDDFSGSDFRWNARSDNRSFGEYSTIDFTKRAQYIVKEHDATTPLFLYLAYQSVHSPLQVPKEYEEEFAFISNVNRSILAAQVAVMDEGIGNLTATLKSTNMWNNTLVIFISDNGGDPEVGGSNDPLKGGKATFNEGGIKVAGFVSGPLIKHPGTINHQLMHATDWYPTIVNLVGGSLHGTNLDGYDMWQSIVDNKESPRTEIIFTIDPLMRCNCSTESDVFDTTVMASLRYRDYKIITGSDTRAANVSYDVGNITYFVCDNDKTIALYNIVKDPEEKQDLSKSEPFIVDFLLRRLAMWNQTAVPVNFPPNDDRCNPALHGGFWSPWIKP